MRPARLLAAALLLGACSSGAATSDPDGSDPVVADSTVAATEPSAATAALATTAPAATAPGTTTAPATTTIEPPNTTTTVLATTAPPTTSIGQVGERVIGTSVSGRPITATERGTPGGTVVVVIGAIHGDESAGLAVINRLRTGVVPAGIDLWLIDAINPDGIANGTRGNEHLVDLNRNFPFDWNAMGAPGDPEYAGTAPASEPETQAVVDFLGEIQPALTLWYHQDLFRVSPGTGKDGQIRQRYAQLTGLPLLGITGGRYTGVAATWVKRTVPGAVSFVVELGPTLSPQEADVHAAAVLEVAALA